MHRISALLCTAGLLLAQYSVAQESSVTLDRISETGEFRIGYVPDAPPMSYHDAEGNPTGYSIKLCQSIAAEAERALGIADLKILFMPLISPEDRIRAVETGQVDIECASTTITMSRRERVDFTLMTFITGGAVLSNQGKPIRGTADLDKKTIAVIPGTTTEAALKRFAEINEFKIKTRAIETHEDGMVALDGGKVDGYASDRAMLVGQVFRSGDRSKYSITRDVFSFEPYGFMVKRGDTEFRLVADRALARLYGGARILRLYQDWFGRYGEPMSPVLEAMYEFQAVGE